MPNIIQTAANVLQGSDASVIQMTAGATIIAGNVLYKDTADSDKVKLAIDTSSAAALVVGIALNGAVDGQPITVQTRGDINPGGTVVVGQIYVVSSTAGAISEVDDIVTGDWVTILGIGRTSTALPLNIRVSGVQAAADVT